jgi:ribosomal protein L32
MNSSITACEGKTAFRSRNTAERVAKAMNAPKRSRNRKDTGHAPARVYRCPYCGEYHITGRKNVKVDIREG